MQSIISATLNFKYNSQSSYSLYFFWLDESKEERKEEEEELNFNEDILCPHGKLEA